MRLSSLRCDYFTSISHLCDFSLRCVTLCALLCFIGLCLVLLCFTLIGFAVPDSMLLYSYCYPTSLYGACMVIVTFAELYPALLYSVLLHCTSHLLYSTLLDVALPRVTLLCVASLHFTSLYLDLLNFTVRLVAIFS